MGSNAALRLAAPVFAVALLAHGADHLRRGLAFPSVLSVVGGLQIAFGLLVVALVFRGHRLAAPAAVAAGFIGLILFTYGHLIPAGTDPYVGTSAAANVNGYSWFTAAFEMSADFAFGCAGLLALRRGAASRAVDVAVPRTP